jgi:hypothetical protein
MSENLDAWLAVLVATFAACFTWYTAMQSRRQADAVLGDLPPIISLFQPQPFDGAFAGIELEVLNHNRRPIYIDRVKFDFPEGMRIFQEHVEERATLMSIFDAVVGGKRDFVFDLPVRMKGAHPSAPPPALGTRFKVTTDESKTPVEPFDVSAVVWYHIDGEDQAHEEKRLMTWRPLIRD